MTCMKSRTPLLLNLALLFLLTLSVGCTNRKADDPRLQEIERVVQVTPLKAQEMLDSILPELSNMSMANRRAWELMSIRVNDKCICPLESDSLLRILEDYYEDGTANERAEIYYYKAAYCRDHGDKQQMLKWLREAGTTADTTAEDFNADIYAGIMAQLSASFLDSNNPKEALVYAKRMLSTAHATEDRIGVYNLLAEIYKANGDIDSAKIYYAKAFDNLTPEMQKDSSNVYRIAKQMKFYIAQGDAATAGKYKPLLLSLINSSYQNEIALDLGDYYYGIGKRDSARYYFELGTHTRDRLLSAMSSHLALYEMDLEEGNTLGALRNVDEYITLRDSLDKAAARERLLELSRQYDYGLVAASNTELKKSVGWRGHINVVLGVGITLLVGLYLVYRRRVNRRVAALIKKLATARGTLAARNEELQQLQAQEAALRKQTAALREQTAAMQANVAAMQRCFDEIRHQREPLMEHLRTLVEAKQSMEREDIQALGELLQTEYPEAMQQCRERQLPVTTQWIIGLHLLGFTNSHIALLTNNSRQNVHNILTRAGESKGMKNEK